MVVQSVSAKDRLRRLFQSDEGARSDVQLQNTVSLNVIDMRNIHYSIITGSKSPSLLSSTSLSMGSLYPISLHPFFSSVVASFLSDLGRVRRYSVGRKLHSHPSAHGNDASPFPKRNNRRTVQVGWNCDASIPSLSGFSLSLRSQCSCAVPSNPRDRL